MKLNYYQLKEITSKEELEGLYKDHTINWITEYYNAKDCGLIRKLFREFGIKIYRCGSHNGIKATDYDELMKKISYDELYNYYVIQHNSIDRCAKHFELTSKVMYKLIIKYNIHKTKDEKNLTDQKGKNEKYGNPYYNNPKQIGASVKKAHELYGDEIVKRAKATKLERYGDENYCGESGIYHYNKYDDGEVTFDSLPELALWKYAIDHHEDIEREPVILKYEFDGTQHSYRPDFRYKGKLIEIKGDHMADENGVLIDFWNNHLNDALYKAKYDCAISNGVQFIFSNEYQKFVDYFNDRYNKLDFLRTKKGGIFSGSSVCSVQ